MFFGTSRHSTNGRHVILSTEQARVPRTDDTVKVEGFPLFHMDDLKPAELEGRRVNIRHLVGLKTAATRRLAAMKA